VELPNSFLIHCNHTWISWASLQLETGGTSSADSRKLTQSSSPEEARMAWLSCAKEEVAVGVNGM
jgi:hypothetical protein